MANAHWILCDFYAERESCRDALASWESDLAGFDTKSKLSIETIQIALAAGTNKPAIVTREELRKALSDLRSELDVFRAGVEASLSHIEGCGGHIPGNSSAVGGAGGESSDEASSSQESSEETPKETGR